MTVTISVGVANVNKDEECILTADERLYKAKNTGKNKVVWE